MTFREDEGGMQPSWALLGWGDALSVPMALTLSPWAPAVAAEPSVSPPTPIRMFTIYKQAGKLTGSSRDRIHRAAEPSWGWAVLPGCCYWQGCPMGCCRAVNYPGFLNAAQHNHTAHTLGEFLTAVSEQERWFISCAWPGNGPG